MDRHEIRLRLIELCKSDFKDNSPNDVVARMESLERWVLDAETENSSRTPGESPPPYSPKPGH